VVTRRVQATALVALLVWGGSVARAAAPGSGDPKRSELRARMEERLARLASSLDGSSGYVLRDLETGETFEKNADAVFPAASTIKLAIFLELFKRAEEGSLDLTQPVRVDPDQRVEGGGVLEKWSAPYPTLTALQLSVLMMDFSDNFATNLLIDRVGMEAVGRRLSGWGLKETRLRRKMMDVAAARAGRENVTTPRELGALLERLHAGRLLGPANTREAIEIMKRNEGSPIKRGLPAGVASADKSGELEGVRACAGIVFVPKEGPSSRPLLVSVMTAYLGDDQAGEVFISEVARAGYEYVGRLARSSEHGRLIGP
jgi:beta-lactamase class A